MKSDRNMRLSTNDCVISVRCKSTTLATLLKYRHQEGTALGLTQGTLARDAMEALAEQIVRRDPALSFDSTTMAREYLEIQGLTKLNTGGKGGFTAFKIMSDEASVGKDFHTDPLDLPVEERVKVFLNSPEGKSMMKNRSPEDEDRLRRAHEEQKAREEEFTKQRKLRQEELVKKEKLQNLEKNNP